MELSTIENLVGNTPLVHLQRLPGMTDATATDVRGPIPHAHERTMLYRLAIPLFVLVSALLKRVDEDNLGNILTYFGSLKAPEVSVMFVKLMLKHKLTLASHPAYAKWAVKHGKLLA